MANASDNASEAAADCINSVGSDESDIQEAWENLVKEAWENLNEMGGTKEKA
jgi:hypothetical protein